MNGLEIISRRPSVPGPGAPLLFVHGAFCGAWIWDECFLPYLAERGHEVHALSLRGHGGSSGLRNLAGTTLADYVDDVRAAVERMERTPILVGHSLGGVVVQRYMRRHSVPAAILMAPGPPHGMLVAGVGMFLRDPWLYQQLCLVQYLGPIAGSAALVRRLLFSGDVPEDRLRRVFSRMQPESLRAGFELALPQFPLSGGRPRPPTLLLGAEQDYLISPAVVKATARVYGLRAEIIPHMAHAMMLDTRWRTVADRIHSWVGSLQRTG